MNTEDFIRKRITDLRLIKNVSEKKMSREIGKSSTYLSALMSNKGLPSLRALIDICDYFEIDISDFFDYGNENPIIQKQVAKEIQKCSENALDVLIPLIEMISDD